MSTIRTSAGDNGPGRHSARPQCGRFHPWHADAPTAETGPTATSCSPDNAFAADVNQVVGNALVVLEVQ